MKSMQSARSQYRASFKLKDLPEGSNYMVRALQLVSIYRMRGSAARMMGRVR